MGPLLFARFLVKRGQEHTPPLASATQRLDCGAFPAANVDSTTRNPMLLLRLFGLLSLR